MDLEDNFTCVVRNSGSESCTVCNISLYYAEALNLRKAIKPREAMMFIPLLMW